RSLRVVVAELTLEQAIDALDLLLLAQLHRVVGQTRLLAAGAVLAGLLLQLALRGHRTRRSLQAQISALAMSELAGGTQITCHLINLSLFQRTGPSKAGSRSCDQE